MKLSDGETLIIRMLCDIFESEKIKSELDPTFIREAISGGHIWGIKNEYQGIFADVDNDKEVKETYDILSMWDMIERGFDSLDSGEQQRVKTESGFDDVQFRGFDGNNDNHYGIARFVVEQMGRFEIFGKRDLNAHFPVMDGYRRMLAVYKPLLGSLNNGLTADHIISILKARVHPSSR
jgi:uncharacterized protein YfbU (UPF0304 family)